MDTNKTLTYLLIISTIVSVAGTFLVLDNLSRAPMLSYTGAATTGYSDASLTITGNTAITVTPIALSFGNIKVAYSSGDGSNCTFQSGAVLFGGQTADGCALVPDNPGFLNITNVGSGLVNITANVTSNATNFLAPFSGARTAGAEELLQLNSTAIGACAEAANVCNDGVFNGTVCGKVFDTLQGAVTDVVGSNVVCNTLNSTSGSNKITVGLNVKVPIQAQPGAKTTTINIFGALSV